MLKKGHKQTFKKKELEVVSLKNTIPLIIPEKILNKIKYLCSEIEEVEWSGVLFYSVEGTIEDFENVKFTVEDIYPMDKGDKTFTSFDLDEDLIDYRMSNPQSLSWKMGLIHSHNTMKTYFSGTDMSELNDNSEFHNYYLSLIVNNFMSMTAKTAFRGKTNGFTCLNEQGEEWTLNLAKEREVLFTFENDIQVQKEEFKLEESFTDRVDFIIEKAAKLAKKAKKFFKKEQKKNKGNKLPMFNFFEEEKPLINPQETSVEDFTRYIMRLGHDTIPHDSLDKALEDIFLSEVSGTEFALSVMNQYSALYEKYFDAFGEIGMEEFISTTNGVVEELEQYGQIYDYLEPLTTNLKMMLNKVEQEV